MTTKKISEFNTASSPLSGTEYLLGIQNGETVKMPVLPTGIVSGGTPEAPINITNHNDVIHLSASYTGEITSYVGSGTTITVLEGIDILTYDGVGENPGTWTATATATNVVVGSFTAVDGTLVVGNHSGISINIDNSLIVYNIIGKRLDGTSFTGSTKQAISKTKSGAPGPSSSIVLTYIETDSPVIVKDAVDAATAGTYSTIVIQGKKTDVDTINYGWVTVTPNNATESLTAIDTAITPYSYTLSGTSGASGVTIKMYDQSNVFGANLLDTQHINVVYKGLPGLAYQVAVESSNGTEFRVGENSSTLLTARIFLNGVEITDSTPASWFRWRRTSMVPNPPPNDDATWNSLYSTGFKQVLIYVDDVDSKATFFCDIISP